MNIKETGNIDAKWIEIAKETTKRSLEFMNYGKPPTLHIAEGYLFVPTPTGHRSVGAGYNHRTKQVTASIEWLMEKAGQLRSIPQQHYSTEELMRFVIAHEVCHYVQDIKGCLPIPDTNMGLLVTDPFAYDELPHEREANIVGIKMSTGVTVPGIGGRDIIRYLKRDPQLRGTGFK